VTHVDLQTILTTWEGDAGAIVLYGVLVALAVAYGLAARRRSPRGRRWPPARTACFLAGLALLALIYGSGLQVYEDQPTVHVIQHMLTMMAAPPLLVLGAPITLLLRTLAPRRRPAIVRLLDDPSLAMLSGPRAPLMLTLDYYLTMYVYQLTPLRTWSEQSTELHFIVHQYFLFCGLFLWWPVVAADPVRLRLSASAKRVMVWLGLPAFGLLGAIELAAGSTAAGVAYLASGAVLTLAGAAVVAIRARRAGALQSAAAPRPRSLSAGSVSGVGGPG
jgi:putative membrane protein